MGMRPHINMNKGELRPWVKVVFLIFVVIIAVIVGEVAYKYFFVANDAKSAVLTPTEIPRTAPLPTPKVFDKYTLAFPEDPVWSKVVAAPSPDYTASTNIPNQVEVTVIGGLKSNAPFPMTCILPKAALVWPFGSTIVDGQSNMLAEYGGQEPVSDGTTMHTVPDGCQIGTLFVPTDDMRFASR